MNENEKERKCKKCGSTKVFPVGPFGYTEHCRDCNNWQASFQTKKELKNEQSK